MRLFFPPRNVHLPKSRSLTLTEVRIEIRDVCCSHKRARVQIPGGGIAEGGIT